MSQSTKNAGTRWSPADIARLKTLAGGNTPTGLIAMKIHRTPQGVQTKAQELKVSLKPVNQKPYNRRKK